MPPVQYHQVNVDGDAEAPPQSAVGGAAGSPGDNKSYNLQRLASPTNFGMLFFVAGASAMVCAVLATLWFIIVPFEFLVFPIDFVNELYLFAGGAVIAVLDAPLNFRWVVRSKITISKYCRLLTRITGRGLYLLFLSGQAFSCMYSEDISRTLGIIVALYVGSVGLITLVIGLVKTKNLNTLRVGLQKRGAATDAKQLQQFCSENRGTRITQNEFVEMSNAIDSSLKWTAKDLRHVFVCFNCETPETAPTDTIAVDDLSEWLQPGLPMML
eukprot:g10031.t1